MDDIDLRILELLHQDGRISHAAISKEIGLSAPSVYARIQKLEQDRVITGYTVLLDPEKIGYPLTAFIRVTLGADAKEAEAFENLILQEPQIVECHDVDGEDSYLLKIRTTSPQALRGLIAQIRGLPHVQRTSTTISLLAIKESGVNRPLLSVEKEE